MAELGPAPVSSRQVADRLGTTTNALAPTRDTLIKKGAVLLPPPRPDRLHRPPIRPVHAPLDPTLDIGRSWGAVTESRTRPCFFVLIRRTRPG